MYSLRNLAPKQYVSSETIFIAPEVQIRFGIHKRKFQNVGFIVIKMPCKNLQAKHIWVHIPIKGIYSSHSPCD